VTRRLVETINSTQMKRRNGHGPMNGECKQQQQQEEGEEEEW